MNIIDITSQKGGVFWIALAEAEKGDRIIYHIGDHCGGSHRKDAAMAAEDSKCFLFCKRLGNRMFAYMAIKR